MRKFLLPFALALAASAASALEVTLAAKSENGDKPVVVGTTNLPDGTDLLITVSRKASDFRAQDKVKVQSGAFRAGPFSQKGSGLNPGTYTLEVLMPVAAVQPKPVQAAIGQEGEKLQGPLVKKAKVGGRLVEYSVPFKIAGGKADAVADAAARRQSDADAHAWWLRSCKDICTTAQGLAKKRGEQHDFNSCYQRCVIDEPKKKQAR